VRRISRTPPPPIKRGRGRPPKNGATQANANKHPAAKTAAKIAKAKAKAKHHSPKKFEKENQPVGDAIDISDSESEIAEGGRKQWSDSEKTKFFDWLLGDHSEGDYRFEQHKKNPGHVYKRVRRPSLFP
jgi:hypothetical protein